MEQYLLLIIRSILISLPFILIGLIFDAWLIHQGYIRPGKKWPIWIGTIIVVFMKILWYDNLPWLVVGSFILLGVTFGVNRGGLYHSIKKGRWWWDPQKATKKKH